MLLTGVGAAGGEVLDRAVGACWFHGSLNNPAMPPAEVLRASGVRCTYLGAYRPLLEPSPGSYDWSHLDRALDAAVARGLEVVVKVTEAGPGVDSVPPADLGAYGSFLTALAGHVAGRVGLFAVENELDRWALRAWDAETYGAVREVARAALRAGNPAALVADSGLTMEAWLAYRLKELVSGVRMGEALALAVRWNGYMRRKDDPLPVTAAQMVSWLAHPKRVRAISFVDELRSHPGTYDLLQVHYLQDAWDGTGEYRGA